MSHFTVAVFTDGTKTIKELLASYDERIEVERYIKHTKQELIQKGRKEIENYKNTTYTEFLKNPEEYKSRYKSKPHINYLENEFPLKLSWTDEEVYQDKIRWYEENEIGEYGEVYSTYNPLSKWDWYQIGGRWSGLLKLKPDATSGGYGSRSWTNENKIISENFVDSAKVKDIDFSPKQEDYDEAIRFWELYIEKQEPQNDKDRELIGFVLYKESWYLDKYQTKEQYAKLSSAFSTYAVVTPDGKWYSKGDMGWFGLSNETTDEARKFEISFKEKFINTADPEWILTIVDCHI